MSPNAREACTQTAVGTAKFDVIYRSASQANALQPDLWKRPQHWGEAHLGQFQVTSSLGCSLVPAGHYDASYGL